MVPSTNLASTILPTCKSISSTASHETYVICSKNLDAHPSNPLHCGQAMSRFIVKLHSYWNIKCFVHCIFACAYRISKRYPKSDADELKILTSKVFNAHDAGFYWSSEDTLRELFIAEQWCGVLMEILQPTVRCWKNEPSFIYHFFLYVHFLKIFQIWFLLIYLDFTAEQQVLFLWEIHPVGKYKLSCTV